MPYFLLILNVLLMTSGQLFFKRSADFISANPDISFPTYFLVNPWFYAAVGLFGLATIVWTQVLTKMPLSVAYPIASAAYILTVIGAAVFFHEQIGFQGILGVLLIMSGIALTAMQ